MTKTISKLLFDSLVVRFLSSHAMNCLSEVIASCFVLCGLFCPSRWRCRIWMQLKGWNCWCYLLNLVPNIYIFWERKRKTPIFSYQHTSSKLDMCMDFEGIKEKVWWRYYFDHNLFLITKSKAWSNVNLSTLFQILSVDSLLPCLSLEACALQWPRNLWCNTSEFPNYSVITMSWLQLLKNLTTSII